MAARPLTNFSTVAEMPQANALRGVHKLGKTIIRGTPGSVDIDLEGEGEFAGQEKPELSGDFNENLAEVLYTSQRKVIAQRLIEYYDIDKQSRADWEQRVDTALVMLGIVKQNKDILPWKGASDVVHPGIAKACVQYQARAIEEFFPPTGPVKCTIVGDQTRDRQDQADRVENFMNWYYTDGDKGYFQDSDQLHFKLPLQGSVFRKSFIDPINGRPKQRHVNGMDFVAPYHGADLESMSRYCHSYRVTGNYLKRAMARGYYVEIELPQGTLHLPEITEETAEDKADDRSALLHPTDDLFEILEYHVDYEMPDEIAEEGVPFALPYIVHVEKGTGEVLRIERNWHEQDIEFEKIVWFTHYRYLPGLGFYGFGLLHIVGSLGEAATGAVRALLDSGARANMQGGFKSKELKGGDLTIENGIWKDVDLSAEELAKAFYTPPTPVPSPALFQLVELLTAGLDQFTTATELAAGDAPTNAPVGTTLAMIEQGAKVFSAIHKRTHASARHEFSMFEELVQFSSIERYPYQFKGQDRFILKADFDDRVDILPVSDPNIWSSTQRIALAQTVFQIVNESPDVYGPEQKREAHRRMLTALKTPDVDALLPEKNPDPYLDPVSENMRMMIGKPSKTWPHQLHAAHVAVHENWLQIQVATQPQEILQHLLPQALAHIQEHKAYMYQQQVMRQLGAELPMFDLGASEEESSPLPPEIESRLSVAAARALLPIPPTAQQQQQSADDAATQAEIKRKDAVAAADAKRKDMTAAADDRRKNLTVAADMRRKDVGAKVDAHRAHAVTAVDQARENAAHEQGQRRQDEAHALDQAHQRTAFDADQGQQADAHALDQQHQKEAFQTDQSQSAEQHDAEMEDMQRRADAESAALKAKLDAQGSEAAS